MGGQLTKGAFGEYPADGVLRGRVGVRRWVQQSGLLLFLIVVDIVVLIGCTVDLQLAALIVFVILSIFLWISCKIRGYAWAWLGIDVTLPVIFDVKADGLDVQWMSRGFFRRREYASTELQDVRVYFVPMVDTEDMHGEQAKPVPAVGVVRQKLPDLRDVAVAFWQAPFSCLTPQLLTKELAVIFLGASVRGERNIVRLSRNIWTFRELEELMQLAHAAREQVGLHHGLPTPTALGKPSSDVIVAPGALKGARAFDRGVDLEAQPQTDVRRESGIDVEVVGSEHSIDMDELHATQQREATTQSKESGGSNVQPRSISRPSDSSIGKRPEQQASASSMHSLPRPSGGSRPSGSSLAERNLQQATPDFEEPLTPAPVVEAADHDDIRVEQLETHARQLPRPKMKSKR